jgi:hypothetical protein
VHVLLDTCIYRKHPKRSKPSFRALTRLASAGYVQIHIPEYVKREYLTYQQHEISEHVAKFKTAAGDIARCTGEPELLARAQEIAGIAAAMLENANDGIAGDFQAWIAASHAIEHPIKPEHGPRVTDAYFAGGLPFRKPKHRDDFPDAFIWQAALDIVAEHEELWIVSDDGRLRETAENQEGMEGLKTLEELIATDECQDGLTELVPAMVRENIERLKNLLPQAERHLLGHLASGIAKELDGKTVRHYAIPEDNNEAVILSVDEPADADFDCADAEYYGDADLGVPFTTTVNCTLNYRIYKGDYFSHPDSDISISEWNDHYFDADQNYDITVEGTLTLLLDEEKLAKDDLTNQDLLDLAHDADCSIEVLEIKVAV